MDESTSKKCSRCSIAKPLSEFNRRTRARDGLNSACRECLGVERMQSDADPVLYAKKLEAMRAWRIKNAEYRAAYFKAHYEANRERYAERGREWQQANRERIKELRKANAESIAASNVRHRERNRERRAERENRRRAITRRAEVGSIDLDALWTGLCALCRESMDRELKRPDPLSKSIDHILPLSRGGNHVQSNLQWAHLVCNVSKGARLPD